MTKNEKNEKRKKKKLQYLRQLVGVRYCGIFLPGNNIRRESKEMFLECFLIFSGLPLLFINLLIICYSSCSDMSAPYEE